MKIDKDKLVELLVEKTSMEKHEVEAQLEQLIERIVSATKRGKALEIKGFGTFYFDSDNELKFDPSRSLSTEISYKYAGMQPVELVPERDTSIPVADPHADIDDPELDDFDDQELVDPAIADSAIVPPLAGSAQSAGQADEQPNADTSGKELAEAAAGDPATATDNVAADDSAVKGDHAVEGDSAAIGDPSTGDQAVEGDSTAAGGHTGGDSTVTGDQAATGDQAVPGDPAVPGDKVAAGDQVVSGDQTATGDQAVPGDPAVPGASDSKEIAEGAASDTKKSAATAPASRKTSPAPASIGSRRQSGAIVWVLLLILLVGAALAAYFYFAGQETEASLFPRETTELSAAGQQFAGNGALSDGNDSEASDEVEPAGEDPEGVASASAVTASQRENVQQDEAQQQAQNGTAPANNLQEESVYGLTGDVIPQANDGYSIVLHSFDEEAKTEEAVQLLTNENYRTIVGSRTVAGRTMWRISVGQFRTLQEAQDAAAELPSPYNTQNFIHRIQLNN